MSQRLDNTKWLCYLLALHAGSLWGSAKSVSVRNPPSNPSTVEAQAKFFQDFFSVQLSPYKIEFGHVCEDPNTWEQRYEKKDFKNHRDMGKVRWGDKKGGYGEHYWDLNHAGHAGNHGDDGDDGSYHESNNDHDHSHSHDPFEDYSDNSPHYGNDEYDPERSSYEEAGRAKRAHPKIDRGHKVRKSSKLVEKDDEPEVKPKKHNHKHKEELDTDETTQEEQYEDDDDDDDEEEEYVTPKPKRNKHYKKQENRQQQEDKPEPKDKNQIVLVVSHKDDDENSQNQYQPQQQSEPQYVPQKQQEYQQFVPKQYLEPPQYVPYEGGAGVRQHQQAQPDVTAASTVPRLFLEPSTGHVVDRATGQAYVLQPIAAKYN